MDHLLTCPVCFDQFDSDLSLFQSEERRRNSHLPVLSHQCPHKICASCLNNWQHRAVSKRARQLPKWFKCPCCAKRTAFDAEQMEIDTFACTMFAHVKANGVTVQQSSEPVETNTRMQTSESFFEHGSARRTEFYYHNHPGPVVDDADQTLLVQHRSSRLRSTSSGASRRKRDLLSALGESGDTNEIRAMLDREDALTSTELFLQSGTSRRSMRVAWSGYFQHFAEVEKTRGADVWKCHCGAMNSSQRKRCPPPCFKWRPGLRTGGKKHDESETEVQPICDDDDLSALGSSIEAGALRHENLDGWECPSCKQISPYEKKLCHCKTTRAGRGCAIPGCSKYSQGNQYNYMCKRHYSQSKGKDVATPLPPPNPHRQDTKNSSPARLKNSYADLKRRDSPRHGSGYCCGSCDACMVDECGKCKNCLDMPRFGGIGISKQRCKNRPPCSRPPAMSRTLGTDLKMPPQDNQAGTEQCNSFDDNTQSQSRKRKRRNISESEAKVDIEQNASPDEDFSRWKCGSCKLVSPCGTKPCGCRAKRRRLCAVPDCMRQSAGSSYDQYCMRHYRHRTSNVSEETPSLNSRQRGHLERKNSYADLERQERAEGNAKDAPQWKCRGCGKTHSSERKRCPPPCRRWKDGRRTRDRQIDAIKQTEATEKQLSNNAPDDEDFGRRKNPYADRKRRDSPRQRSRHRCGSCDACMVDDCGECRNCLDKPRFGGSLIRRQNCVNLPPCYKPPSACRTLDEDFAGASERNVPSDEDEVVYKEDDDDVDSLFEVLAPGRYEYVPLPTDGAKDVQYDDIIVTLFTTGWERGKVEDIDRASPSQKRVAKEFSIPRLVRYVSDSSYWLHDLDDPTIYLTEEQFNNLNAGSTEASEGVKVGAWCVVRRTDSPRNPSPGVLV